MTENEALRRLEEVCRVAVLYTGMANYDEREQHAYNQVKLAFENFRARKWADIKFSEKETED